MTRGSTFTLTYKLTAKAAVTLALGAALYDESGADQADGTGDEDAVAFPAGTTSQTRQVLLPNSLVPGAYEVDGELWPPGTIGDGEPIKAGACGDVTVR